MITELTAEAILRELSGTGAGPIAHTDVKKYLRHTHPMLGVDRIVDHQFSDGWIHAVRAVSCSHPAFEGHFPDAAIYPGTSLAQDVVQVAIILFVGATGELRLARGEISVVSSMTLHLGHPVPPGALLDVLVWRTKESGPRSMEVSFEVRMREFPFYDRANQAGITFQAALRGSCVLKRLRRSVYDGIGI